MIFVIVTVTHNIISLKKIDPGSRLSMAPVGIRPPESLIYPCMYTMTFIIIMKWLLGKKMGIRICKEVGSHGSFYV